MSNRSTHAQVIPYGSWKSPITSDLIVAKTIRLGEIRLDGGDVYWSEMRPQEGGRNVIRRRTATGEISDMTPTPFNVRSRVHEYGGGAFNVIDGVIYFVNFADQRLYRQVPGSEPEPLTPEGAWRYADMVVDHQRDRLLCVREDHSVQEDHSAGEHEPVNALVSISLSEPTAGLVLASGDDFYSTPRLSPDGAYLSWLSWNHPQMPWDTTTLWIAAVQEDGMLATPEAIAGGASESICQPEWSPDGKLYFVSDRTGWWNLYRWHPDGDSKTPSDIEPVCEKNAEFGLPHWVFTMTTYGFISADELLCTYVEAGIQYLARMDLSSMNSKGQLTDLDIPYAQVSGVHVAQGNAFFVGSAPTIPATLVKLDLATEQAEELYRSSPIELDPGYLSVPKILEFPTSNQQTAYGFYYAPTNQDYDAPPGEQPPLLVKSHGGPTAATTPSFNLGIQYWTSRGFAVLDVNYGGSTGYGRAYRQRLQGNWGVVDVEDCINGAKYLAQRGLVDGDRLCIDGGSAGGYTTLASLTFHDVFKAGASYYGVSDLAVLAQDTHKFESRYLDGLVGPYPEQEQIYRERSPIHFIDRLSCPVIFFQGDEDKIVPPNQAEMMVDALRQKGLPVAYMLFEGEQHGFRKADNIKRSLDAELYFYSRVFGFELADPIEPVAIDNLES
jgi:dipeptidyl aminopeptidase/acylaminoacyl peptidase